MALPCIFDQVDKSEETFINFLILRTLQQSCIKWTTILKLKQAFLIRWLKTNPIFITNKLLPLVLISFNKMAFIEDCVGIPRCELDVLTNLP